MTAPLIPANEGEVERLREVLRATRDALKESKGSLMLYDGHVTNPTSREGWSDTDGHDAYMAATRAIQHADRALSTPAQSGEETNTTWACPQLDRAYREVERLREQVAQHPESGIDESLRRALEAIEAADCELTGFAS